MDDFILLGLYVSLAMCHLHQHQDTEKKKIIIVKNSFSFFLQILTVYKQFWPQGSSGQVLETFPQLVSSFHSSICFTISSLILSQSCGNVHYKMNLYSRIIWKRMTYLLCKLKHLKLFTFNAHCACWGYVYTQLKMNKRPKKENFIFEKNIILQLWTDMFISLKLPSLRFCSNWRNYVIGKVLPGWKLCNFLKDAYFRYF